MSAVTVTDRPLTTVVTVIVGLALSIGELAGFGRSARIGEGCAEGAGVRPPRVDQSISMPALRRRVFMSSRLPSYSQVCTVSWGHSMKI